MDDRIIAFLDGQQVLTLAVCDEEVYAATLFYAFDREHLALIFASDSSTKHMQMALRQKEVAGTIYDPDIRIDRLRGVQLRGSVRAAKEDERRIYLKRYPFAAAMRPELWSLELTWIKYTDNRLGFGKKLIWTPRSNR